MFLRKNWRRSKIDTCAADIRGFVAQAPELLDTMLDRPSMSARSVGVQGPIYETPGNLAERACSGPDKLGRYTA